MKNSVTPKDNESAMNSSRIERMKIELAYVSNNLAKLKGFLNAEAFAKLPAIEKHDLIEQSQHMENYAWVLQRRLRRAEE